MVSVDYMIFARKADNTGGEWVIEGGGFNVMWAHYLPVVAPTFFVAVGLHIGWNDAGIPYRGEVRVIDADSRLCPRDDGIPMVWTNTPAPVDGIPDGEDYVSLMCMEIGEFVLPRFGTYVMEIWINGVRSNGIKFFVEHADKQKPPPVSHHIPTSFRSG